MSCARGGCWGNRPAHKGNSIRFALQLDPNAGTCKVAAADGQEVFVQFAEAVVRRSMVSP